MYTKNSHHVWHCQLHDDLRVVDMALFEAQLVSVAAGEVCCWTCLTVGSDCMDIRSPVGLHHSEDNTSSFTFFTFSHIPGCVLTMVKIIIIMKKS